MKAPSPTLERYALKVHHYGRITGVSLATHAIPDAFLLLHAGVGCKYKAAAQISIHDWARQPHRREGWTEVGDGALIRGAASRIGPYVRAWYDRQKPALVLLCTASFLELVGEDVSAAVSEAASTVPCEVAYVPGFGFDGDLYDGYAQVVRAVLSLVDFSGPPRAKGVSVVGYLHDRHEADHQANQQQLRALLGELGLTLDAVLLGGQPLARLRQAGQSGLLVALPMAHRLRDALEATGRQVVYTGLPMGLSGTGAWLEAVGQAAGVPASRIAEVNRRLGDYARGQLAPLGERTLGGRSALYAETPAAVGLASFLEEVGLPVRLVGLGDRSYGGAGALERALQALGSPLRGDAEVLEDPSFWLLGSHLERLIEGGDIRLMMGSAGAVSALRRRLERQESSPIDSRVARVITGFPSTGYHALAPMPTLGYGGAVALGHRLMEALWGGSLG